MAIENIDFNSITLFQGKRLGDIMNEIYTRSKEKEDSINSIVDKISNMMDKQTTALMLAPIVSQFMEAGIKNDDQLIKLISVIQKFLAGKANQEDPSNSFNMTDEEKERLMAEYKDLNNKDTELTQLINDIHVPNS